MLLPDTGRNYLSKLYNDDWMRSHGLIRPSTTGRVGDLLTGHHHGPPLPPLVVAVTTESVGKVISRMQEYGISQMPVADAAATNVRGPGGSGARGQVPPPEALVGSVSDRDLLDRAFRDPGVVERTVGEVMGRPLPLVDASATVEEAFDLLSKGAQGVVVVRNGVPAGIATRLDLLEFVNHRLSGALGGDGE